MGLLPVTVGGFHMLPISMPSLPAYPHAAVHYIYLRRNEPRVPTTEDARSLFLTNLPVDSTELHLRSVFAALVGVGRFESVTFEDEQKAGRPSAAIDALPAQAAKLLAHSKKRKRDDEEQEAAERAKEDAAARLPDTWMRRLRRSESTAVVMLADEKSVEQLLKATDRLVRNIGDKKSKRPHAYPVWGERIATAAAGARARVLVPPLGAAWLRAHSRLTYPADRAALQTAVDAFFAAYNRREREAAELAKRLRSEPDEDGFVTVTRSGGSRSAPASAQEAEEARQKMLARQKKRREETTNFYRFQTRERKQAEQAELVRRFEEDTRKVAAMRERRGKFRPEA